MSDLTKTTAKIALVHPEHSIIFPYITAVAVDAGQAVYINSAGKVALADANGSGTSGFRGIALESCAAGQVVSVLAQGALYGYDLSGLDYDAPVYLSDTAGALATAGSVAGDTVVVGRVMPLTDKDLTKVLWVEDVRARTDVETGTVDKAALADEVVVRFPLVVEGVFDNQTITVGAVPDACTIVGIDYFTGAALDEAAGIDVIDGGADGNGTDVIASCTDGLNGYEAETTINATHKVLAAGDILKVKVDDLTTATYCRVVIWLSAILNEQAA